MAKKTTQALKGKAAKKFLKEQEDWLVEHYRITREEARISAQNMLQAYNGVEETPPPRQKLATTV